MSTEETQQMTVVEFLRARLDEDEAAARAAMRHDTSGEWEMRYPRGSGSGVYVVGEEDGYVTFDQEGLSDSVTSDEKGLHIARHDPARALREAEAKRAILSQWDLRFDGESGEPLGGQGAEVQWDTLRTLAAVYADHPDYRDEWRPVVEVTRGVRERPVWHVTHKPTSKTLCGQDNDGTKPAEGLLPCNACATAMYDIFGDLLDELEAIRTARDEALAKLAAVERVVSEAAIWKGYQTYDVGHAYDAETVEDFVDSLRTALRRRPCARPDRASTP